ncbi:MULTISPECIES: FGGY-family carbohydrate kinase [Vibrio]|uniref:FGGY-family carbohydrate kinase n=1 Tax=Vibrio TaxID=662 RepID=UPI000619E4CB|nr:MULTISPECIES: FGGY-family carbohydrate kinase [Vibrio]
MSSYFIGIDNGSQSTKVAIYSSEGEEVCTASVLLRPTDCNDLGWVTHPDDDIWDSVWEALEQCVALFPYSKELIKGIGLCSMRCCRVLLNREGELVEPVISWMDVRMGKPYAHIDDRVKYVTTTSGYLSHKLTGNTTDSASNYEVHWPINPYSMEWPDDLEIATKGLVRSQLFELKNPGDSLGVLRPDFSSCLGLSSDICVYATANDKAVETLGAGVERGGEVMVSLGTFISAMMVGDEHFPDETNFFSTFACEPYKYVYESDGIRRGMWTISWFKNLIGQELIDLAHEMNMSEEDVLNECAQSVPVGSDGLVTILDWLSPIDKQYRKGAILGFDERHTKYHMYRSLLEAIAYSLNSNLLDLFEAKQEVLKGIVATGGGAKSALLLQILSNVTGVPVKTVKTTSVACLGAAMCAGLGVGTFSSFSMAKNRMIKYWLEITPHPIDSRQYQAIYHNHYKNIRRYTDPLFISLEPITMK